MKCSQYRFFAVRLLADAIGLLAHPYTRPADFRGWPVPEILLSGDPKKVDAWRHEQSLNRTEERRPDLMKEE